MQHSPRRDNRCYRRGRLSAGLSWAGDQFINNPAYDRQRGPVSVFALRVHAEF
jgi:hypothetical protein